MKRGILLWLVVLHLFHLRLPAQSMHDSAAQAADSPASRPYIKLYDNYLNVTTGWNTRNTRYILSYPQYDTRFVLSPKETDQFFVNVDYSFLFLYYSFTPRVFNLNSSDSIKGNTSRSTFGFGFAFQQWHINFDFQNIKGYYLRNTEEFLPGWQKGDAYIQFPDLRTIQKGGQVGYNFNKNFSISSLASGKEQQLRNVLTLFPILAYWNIRLKDDVVDSVQQVSQDISVNNDINVLVPVAATLVIRRNYYVSAFAGPIAGVNFFRATAYDETGQQLTTSGTKISTGYYARASVGYTGKTFFMGVDGFVRYYSHQQQMQRFSKQSYGIQVYAGTRFNAPRFLVNAVGWLEKRNPL